MRTESALAMSQMTEMGKIWVGLTCIMTAHIHIIGVPLMELKATLCALTQKAQHRITTQLLVGIPQKRLCRGFTIGV